MIIYLLTTCDILWGFPGGASGKEVGCQCRRHKRLGLSPWEHEDPLQEGMATLSSTLAWRIPWTEEPGGLQFIGSQRVGHDGSNLAPTHACINWDGNGKAWP